MAKEINCKVGRGSFFINSYKAEQQHPDYKGSININGTPEELALWNRADEKDNTKYFLRCVCQATKTTFILNPVKKEDAKKPDFKGSLEFEGKKYNVSGWMNTTQSGIPYCSLSIGEYQASETPAAAPTGFPTFGNTNLYQNAAYPTLPQPETPASVEQATIDADIIPF